jgi:CAAX protease family protein
VTAVQRWLRSAAARSVAARLAGPFLLWIAVLLCAVALQLPVIGTALPYGAYLFGPLVITAWPDRSSAGVEPRLFIVALLLWLPLVFWLPRIRLLGGYDISQLIAVCAGLYLFLVIYRLERIGYSFALTQHDVQLACVAFVAFAVVAIPAGLESRFLVWHPRLAPQVLLVSPWHIYLATAVPEEFLFRGVIQNLLVRRLGASAGLLIAAAIFGLAHLPDYRYALLATLAGIAYGWVYLRTDRITASAVTHAAVDWIWILAFRR